MNRLIFAFLSLSASAFAAISVDSAFEIRTATVTTYNNGGGFVTGATGTDYSQQDVAQFSGADLVYGAGANQFSSASHSFVATDVGNLIRVINGFAEYFGNNGWTDLTAHARQNVTGDMDFQMDVSLADWTPSADADLFNKAPTNASGFGFRVLTTGELQWYYGTGSAYVNVNSTVPTGITDGTKRWIRVTVDVDNGASGGDVKFYTGVGTTDAGITWTQLGTTVTTGSVIVIPSHQFIAARIGKPTTSITGKVYYIRLYNGIGGTLVIDTDFYQAGDSTYYFTDYLTNDYTNAGTASFTSFAAGNIQTGYYQVVSVAGGVATMDRGAGVAGAGSGARWALGGALKDIGQMSLISGNVSPGYNAWFKGPVTYSPQFNNKGPNGRATLEAGSSTTVPKWEAYGTTRGDRAARYTVDMVNIPASSQACFALGGNGVMVGFAAIGTVAKGNVGFAVADHATLVDCVATNCLNGFTGGNTTGFFSCYALTCTYGFANLGNWYGCIAKSCTGAGWNIGANGGRAFHCLDDGSAVGFNSNTGMILINCAAVNGSSHGFNMGISDWQKYLIGCIAYGRGGYGFAGTNASFFADTCAGGGNTSGNFQHSAANQLRMVRDFKTLSANPFNNTAIGDYKLNNITGGGAVLRGVSLFNNFANDVTAGNADMGPVQSTGGIGATGGTTAHVWAN